MCDGIANNFVALLLSGIGAYKNTLARGRRVGHGNNQFRIIIQSGPFIGIRPGHIKNKFTIRIVLDIHRYGCKQPVLLIKRDDVLRIPAIRFATSVFFERSNKLVTRKRVILIDQGIPVLRADITQTVQNVNVHGEF